MKHNWTLDELIDSWTLLPIETELGESSKADYNRLGFSLLLKYFQIEGKFPHHRRETPQAAIDYVARQLKLSPDILHKYNWMGRTSVNHRRTIRAFLGFRESTVADVADVDTWLQEHILPHTQRLDALITAVYERYRSLKIEPANKGTNQTPGTLCLASIHRAVLQSYHR